MLQATKVPFKKESSLSKNEALGTIFKSPYFNISEERKQRKQQLMNDLLEILSINYTNMKSSELENYIKQNFPIQTGLNNPILRTKSKEIEIKKINSSEIQEFGKILLKAMEMYDGIGLAAPQIGENIRMIAVCQLDKKEKHIISATVMINPTIIEAKGEYICEEGCLSLPGLEGKVKRFAYVKVKYYDLKGEEKVITAHNLNAAILQHEIDHLDGILFWDKVINKQPPTKLNIDKLVQF